MKNMKETLEEAAERLCPIKGEYFDKEFYMVRRIAFIEGAKWQAERMYSEEEVLELIKNREDYMDSEDNILDYQTIKEWFEQFKKK